MSNERLTDVPEFMGELDGGVFQNKIAVALSEVAFGVLNNGQKGKVTLTFELDRMSNSVEEKRVMIKHKLDSTETPMYVNRGGKLTILQEDQGQLFSLKGDPDAKLRSQQ